jgi:hypothetical protein
MSKAAIGGIVVAVLAVFALIVAGAVAVGHRATKAAATTSYAPNGHPIGPVGHDPVAVNTAATLDRTLAETDWHRSSAAPDGTGVVIDGCWPAGWGTGATSRYRLTYQHILVGQDSDGEVFVTIVNYDSAADAARDLRRAESETWRACDAHDIEADEGTDDVSVTRLPADASAPGVGYRELVDRGEEDTFEVVVGHERGSVGFCGCTQLETQGKQQVAAQVAAVLATEQGLPIPQPH